jgi:phage major head subunit gpT-like protein
MTNLTEESLEAALTKLANMVDDMGNRIAVRPSHLIVPPSMFKQSLKILFYKPPIRRATGRRKRKLALYWR